MCLFCGLATNQLSANLFDIDDLQVYVGASGGVSILTGHHNSRTNTGRESHFTAIGGTNGLIGGVLGVQKVFCNDLFLGIQGNVYYNTLDRTVRTHRNADGVIDHGVHVRNDIQYGADARLGWNLCGVNLFVLGGVEAGQFRSRIYNRSAVVVDGIPPGSFHRSRTAWGPKVGVGVNFPVTCCLYASMEYNYTWFNHLSRRTRFGTTVTTGNHRLNVRQNAFLVGLNYMF